MTGRVLIRQLFMIVHRSVGGIRVATTMLVADGHPASGIAHGHTAIHAESGERLTQQQYEHYECAKAHEPTLASDGLAYKRRMAKSGIAALLF